MHFEEALLIELNTIPELTGKIFPLYAEEGEQPPFLIYASSEGIPTRTLDAWTLEKLIVGEIHITALSYGRMKTIAKAVFDKLSTFRGRAIGNGGILIKSLSYEQPVETFDRDFGYYRTSFELIVRI